MISGRFETALAYASIVHTAQRRKAHATRIFGKRTRGLAMFARAFAMLVVMGASSAWATTFGPPPGSFDRAATAAQICTLGYARRHRKVPYRIRDAVYARYGLPRGTRRGYVIDHLVPLELGGRNDVANLWPQTRADARRKDRDENRLHDAVCAGSLSLADARKQMLARWRP